MDEKERQIRLRLKNDFSHYASKCLKIRSKNGEIRPFLLNTAQKFVHEKVEQQKREKGWIRAIMMKGRQQGISTYVEGRFYWRVTHSFGTRAFILTHDNDATNNLFEMAQRYHEYCPPVVKPRIDASNAKELIFGGLDSGYKLGTAGNKAVGRSSTIQLLHGSEVAYWPNATEHAKGILQAVPNAPGTEIFFESTANGIGNYFHEQWQLAEAGQSDFIPIFVPWYWQEEYCREPEERLILSDEEAELVELYQLTDAQLNWRRYKIIELSVGGLDGTKAFMQEYPCSAVEAFQTTGEDCFINPSIVMVARKCDADPYGHLVIGCDPARFGDDRTAIIRRRTRKAYGLEFHAKKDTMEIANLMHRIIQLENPRLVCIDIGGLGAGVYDRLCELGHREILVAVNGGESPFEETLYYNKRAEMWGLMKNWLIGQPAEIPDDDALHADLCSPRYKYDSKTRIMLEKKEDMKKRGLRSPDGGDALALTFAMPDSTVMTAMHNEYDKMAKDLMQGFHNVNRLKERAYRA